MNNQELTHGFGNVSTPLIVDAGIRLGVPLQHAPSGIHPIIHGSHMAGHVLPVRHCGSVDIFLEALENARAGAILIIDNQGRTDGGYIGDLTVLEAQSWGLAGIILWGCYRDSAELTRIGFPVFSYGTCPAGPVRLDRRGADALRTARMGSTVEVGRGEIVFADADGVFFVAERSVEEVLVTARSIRGTERKQAKAVRAGKTLRDQFRFGEYLSQRNSDPGYTFRTHLRKLGGSIEE